jgi:two-component system OmpR family sensor kinase
VRNAVKFTGEQTSVKVEAVVSESQLTVTVADRGPGVSAHAREQMFEPFRRVGTDPVEGFGLGLSIAKRAVEFHGGGISALDHEGGGLLVRITLQN